MAKIKKLLVTDQQIANEGDRIASAAEPKPETNGKKTECPISRERFRAKAPRALSISIAGQPLAAELKEFSTGSFGWFTQGKISLEVDGVVVKAQVGLNIIIVGSKEA